VKGLKDPSPRVRAECARALGEAIEEASLIASAAVGPLLRAMNDPDRDVRGRATGAVGLMTIRPDVAVPALLEALKVVEPRGGKQIITIRETALMALGNFGSATEAKKAVPILMDIARNEPLDGSIAMTSLAKMRHDRDKIYALFMDLLKHSPDERVRLHAIDCLGMMGADAKAAYPTLMAMLESDDGKNPFRTTCLVGAVAAVGPHDERYARAVIRVCRLYEDAACSRSTASEASTIHSTFYYLLRQLAEAGPTAKPALPMLLGLLDKHPEEPGFDFATELARAFAAIGPPAIDALVEHLKSSQLQIRIRTILVLGMIGPPAKGALPALQAIAKQSGDAHRAEAARARDSIRLINGDQGDGRVPKEAGRSAR
jgi:HEAT repeat protein